MPFFTLSDGDRLYYEVHGEGPALLLVPGLGGVGAFWSVHLPRLTQRFKVVLHDHRGTGQSSRTEMRYSVDQMADDVAQLITGLRLERAHLIGHSTGGAIGQTLAIDRPELIDRLVLTATWTAADDYFHRLFDIRSQVLRDAGMAVYAQLSSLFMRPPWWTQDNMATVLEEEARAAAASTPEIMLSRIEAIVAFDRRDDLLRIAAPTLVVGAQDDMVAPAYYSEALAELIPGAELAILPDGGHFFPVVAAEEFQRVVLEFLGAGAA